MDRVFRRALVSGLSIIAVVYMSLGGTLANAQSSRRGPAPIFKGNTNDGLPSYVCAADAFASYYPLQQIQASGLDVKNGFHLGIVPFLLDGTGKSYDVSEDQRADLLGSGDWDCLLTTLDSVALKGQGVITTVIDESAGADQIWARGGLKTLNDLKGKRIAYAENSVGQFMVLYALAVAGLRPERDVTVVASDSVASAVDAFNNKQADAVSGWEPDILDAARSGGQKLIASDKLRVAIDVIVTSRNAVKNRADVVQKFHAAWFAALKAQFEAFDKAAADIIAWGHTDWSLINTPKDLQGGLTGIAQATLDQNVAIMKDPSALVLRLDAARRVWAVADVRGSTDKVETLVEPKFVLELAGNADLVTAGKPVNATFLMGSRVTINVGDKGQGQTVAVLPCRRFDFLPDSTILTRESKRILEVCVLPVMQATAGTFLRIIGSSAWPGPAGTFGEQDIKDFGLARAVSVRDYLISKGIDSSRFVIDSVVPPAERRNSEDEDVQAQDRFVELTLLESGR